jgi:hypothetical protein
VKTIDFVISLSIGPDGSSENSAAAITNEKGRGERQWRSRFLVVADLEVGEVAISRDADSVGADFGADPVRLPLA